MTHTIVAKTGGFETSYKTNGAQFSTKYLEIWSFACQCFSKAVNPENPHNKERLPDEAVGH